MDVYVAFSFEQVFAQVGAGGKFEDVRETGAKEGDLIGSKDAARDMEAALPE